MFHFKMAAINEFSFRKNSHVTKILKTTFPKDFFNKIWLNMLKVGKYKYIFIFEMKLEKIILFRNGGQNKFCNNAQVVYAN